MKFQLLASFFFLALATASAIPEAVPEAEPELEKRCSSSDIQYCTTHCAQLNGGRIPQACLRSCYKRLGTGC
ncbi:hypothetical protein BJ508DRAFT_335260 [Ascobolus immersus RN42]|uniref:Uncharacterized protein n=1 Tax=Ascobolus immersus RN42 TaxID=1160509 RepID=A0A3N4HGL5_ASCIM|nr:hypothetical protein BJ508DRAFT_335260 [Ascobolus immersus RN42]